MKTFYFILFTTSLLGCLFNSLWLNAIVLIFFILVIIFLTFLKRKYIPSIPIIPNNSFIGYTETFLPRSNVHDKFLSNTEKYGGIYQYTFLGSNIVNLTDMKLVQKVLREVINKGFFYLPNPHIPKNVFNMDTNSDWRLRRQEFSKSFSQLNLNKYEDVLKYLINKLKSKLEFYRNSTNKVNIDKLFSQFTIDVIAEIGFQYKINALDNSDFLRVFNIEPFKTVKISTDALNKTWENIFQNILKLRDENKILPGNLSYSMLKLSENPNISVRDILGEISILFIAGHETTAHTLSWYFYSMCKYPEIQELNREALKLFDFDTHRSLPEVVEATLKESMRKFTVAPSGSLRRVVADEGYVLTETDLGEKIVLPKGTWIQIPLYALHNSKYNWGPSSKEFDPMRWMNASIKSNSKGSYTGWGPTDKYLSFAPFSYGPRNCLGLNLALMELKFVIPLLLNSYKFEFDIPSQMDDESKVLKTHLTLHPDSSFVVKLEKLAPQES